MPDRYAMAKAAMDLETAGLLQTVLVADGAAWRAVPAADAPGAFHGAILDSRRARSGVLFVGLPGSRVEGRRFAGAALVAGADALVGPGAGPLMAPEGPIPPRGTVLVSPDPLAALPVLAGCWRDRMNALVVGVTGSNGKTTTKDFLAALLGAGGSVSATSGNLNSAQGVPVTLLEMRPEHRYAVVEMGASAVGHIAARAATARPRVGVITNAAGAHLEEFGSLDGVIEGKGEMVAALPDDGVAVLNADSPGFERWCARARCRVVSWGAGRGDHRWTWTSGDTATPGWLDLDGDRWPVPLPGRHNAANLCAAILAARAAGLADPVIREGLAAFRASPQRADLRRLGGRLILDDSYNANPTSMEAAVAMLLDLDGGRSWGVLGAMGELGADADDLHRRCGRRLRQLGLDRLVAVGAGAGSLADGFAAEGGAMVSCDDHAAAADLIAEQTRPGDRILIKGSRSATMERVLEELGGRIGWTEDER